MTLTPVLSLAVLLVLALLAARLGWRSRTTSLGVNLIFAVGTHLLALGVLLGPVTDILSGEILNGLTPFLALGLGWTGMLIGAQLDRQQLRRFPRRLAVTPLVQGAVAFSFALLCGWGIYVLAGVKEVVWAPLGPAVLTLAAVTAVSTPAVVAVVSHSYRSRGPVTRFLLFVASLDGLVGLLAVAAIFAFHRPTGAVVWITDVAWVWLAVTLLAGVLVGLVFLSLTRRKPSPDELVLFLGGTILFGSGIAYSLNLSPLVVCLIAGIVITNLSRFHRRVYAMLATWEKPIYGIFLIIAGAMLRPPGWLVIPLVIALLAVRGGAKVFGLWAALRILRSVGDAPPRAGLGLYAHGGLALAIAIGYAVNYEGHAQAAVDMVFAAVVLTVAISELMGAFLLKAVLDEAGELRLQPSIVTSSNISH